MRTTKTSTKNRGHYTYYFQEGRSVILEPGKNGVTETFIKYLHSEDDKEVYRNLKSFGYVIQNKNYNPEDPMSRKTERILNYCFNDTVSRDNQISSDKRTVEYEASKFNSLGSAERMIVRTRISEIAKDHLTKTQQTILCLMYQGYRATEIAKMLRVSDAAISKQKEKIKAVFTEHYLNN